MPSPDRVLEALDDAVKAITRAAYLDVDEAFQDGLDGEIDCDREHCDDYSCSCPDGSLDSGVVEVVTSTLRNLRMGYETPTLREVLEEMERIIENG